MNIHPCMGNEGGCDDDRVGRQDQRPDFNDRSDLKDPVQVSVPCSDDKVLDVHRQAIATLPSKQASRSPLCKAPPQSMQPTGAVCDPDLHSAESIIIVSPMTMDSCLLKFITTITSFVAKDFSVLEQNKNKIEGDRL